MDSVVEVEFRELCRICANPRQQNQGLMISIFDKDGGKIDLLEKMKRYLPIYVSKDDGFPETVCISCTSKLNVCHQLVETCTEANARLQALKQQLDIETSKLTCYSPEPHYDDLHSKEISSDSDDNTTEDKAKDDSRRVDDDKSKATSSRTIYEAGDSQVAVILAEKDEKQNSKPNLSIVLVNVPKEDPSETSVMERVETAIKLYRERCNRQVCDKLSENTQRNRPVFLPWVLNRTSYACFTCKLKFVEKDDMVYHFLQGHPDQVFKCTECGEHICGNKDTLAKHKEQHKSYPLIFNKDEDLLNEMASLVDPLVAKFKVVKQIFHVIPLGEYDPNIKKTANIIAQTNKIISLAKRSKKIIPDMLDKVIKLIKKFCGTAKISFSRPQTKDILAPVTCNICNKYIKNKRCLAKHKYTYHSPRSSFVKGLGNCVHCKTVSVPDSKLDYHMERYHSKGKYLVCTICDKKYKETGQEQPHMKLCKQFSCTYKKCSQAFRTQESLDKHVKTVHDSSPVLCNFCGKIYKNKVSLSFHIKAIHMNSQSCVCEICGKKFLRKYLLRAHVRNFHGNDSNVKVKCDECGKLVLKRYISSHKSIHRMSAILIPCKVCGKTFSKKTIQYHELRHDGVRNVKCPICNAYSKTAEALDRHMKRHERGETIITPPYLQTVTCDICNKVMLRFQLKNHKNFHLKIDMYECDICKRSFPSKGFLALHLKNHDAAYLKALVCTICNRQQPSVTVLRDHVATHNNHKNHECTLCGNKYYFSSGLYKHMQRTHNVKYHMNNRNKQVGCALDVIT